MNPGTAALLTTGITSAVDLVGGILGRRGQKEANRQNLQIAREQMNFQRYMSNTAYRRAATDLEAAGLNRILALGKPATTPAGQTARMENPNTALAASLSRTSNAIATGLAVRRNAAEIKNIEATTARTQKETEVAEMRRLIMTHGEEVASIAADIGRTVRAIMGNKTPEEMATIIMREINKARTALTNALESWSTTARDTKSIWEQLKRDVSIYINDMLYQDQVNTIPWSKDSKYHPDATRGMSDIQKASYLRLRRAGLTHQQAVRRSRK